MGGHTLKLTFGLLLPHSVLHVKPYIGQYKHS
jgi:hypothetical protein